MEEQGQIETLLTAIVIGQIVIYAFLRMVGGHGLGMRVLRWEMRVLRGIVGYPVVWLGQIVGWTGKKIVR
jgi:hypothetical protein